MQILLDTHALLWWLADDPRLPSAAAAVIADTGNQVIVSAASAWEIAIKKAVGRLDVPDDLPDVLDASGFDGLPITMSHALAAGSLPRHHDDPFDRMLIAQSHTERLILITVDRRFSRYDVDLLSLD